MKPLTKHQQILNCLLAMVYWSKVRPISVNLRTWKCGSQACFGGHLVEWEDFKAMGIVPSHCDNYDAYAPRMDKIGGPMFVSLYLFGSSTMFDWRERWEGNTDYRIIVRRLENQILYLQGHKT